MSIAKTIITTAFSIGDADDPQFARIRIDERQLARIEEIAKLCGELQLSLVTAYLDVPLASFGLPSKDGDDTTFEGEHRIVNHELHISARHLWWHAEPKHGEGDTVETHMIAISVLREAFAESGDTVYINDGEIDPTLASAIEEAMS